MRFGCNIEGPQADAPGEAMMLDDEMKVPEAFSRGGGGGRLL